MWLSAHDEVITPESLVNAYQESARVLRSGVAPNGKPLSERAARVQRSSMDSFLLALRQLGRPDLAVALEEEGPAFADLLAGVGQEERPRSLPGRMTAITDRRRSGPLRFPRERVSEGCGMPCRWHGGAPITSRATCGVQRREVG